MRNALRTGWLLLLVCSSVVAFERKEALECFQAIRDSIGSYPHATGKFLFLQVEGRYEEDSDSEREMVELEALSDAIGKYLLADIQKHRFPSSPFGQKLTKLLVPEVYVNHHVPAVESTTVFEKPFPNGFSRVLAFDRAVMEKLRAQHLEQAERDVAKLDRKEWLARLKLAYREFRTPGERRTLVQLLGCPIVLLFHGGDGRCDAIQDEVAQTGAAELAKFLASAPEKGHFFALNAGPPWNQVWKTKGKAVVTAISPQGKHPVQDPRDAPGALELLAASIEANPASEKQWLAMGKLLEKAGQYPDALVVYLQARHVGAEERLCLQKIAQICAKGGMKTNANGLQWYLQMIAP